MLKRRKLGEARPTSSEVGLLGAMILYIRTMFLCILQESRPDPVIKANPMPDFSTVFVPVVTHKTTEIIPFTFEERYQNNKPSLVQQILEKHKENENVSGVCSLDIWGHVSFLIHRDLLRPILCHHSPPLLFPLK